MRSIPATRPKYSFKSPRKQRFSLPLTTVFSMMENPSSPKGLLKLFQTCKYFYSKRPIFIVDHVKIFNHNNHEVYFTESLKNFKSLRGSYQKNFRHEKLAYLQIPIWVTNKIEFILYCNYPLTQWPKFFRYSITNIDLFVSTLTYEDFVLLTSEKTVIELNVSISQICHPDGTKASIDEILQHLPNIRKFKYFIDAKCSDESLTKLNALKLNNIFEFLFLEFFGVHSTFNWVLFEQFIMSNSDATTEFKFICDEVSKENLNSTLQNLNPKWKNEAHRGLKKLFREIDPWW